MPVTKMGFNGENEFAAMFYGESGEYPDAWALPECIKHLTLSEPDFHRDRNGNLVCVHCKDKDTPHYEPDDEFLSTLRWNVTRRDNKHHVLEHRQDVAYGE